MNVEGAEAMLLSGIQGPRLIAIQQQAEQTGLVNHHLGVDGQHGSFTPSQKGVPS